METKRIAEIYLQKVSKSNYYESNYNKIFYYGPTMKGGT